MSQMNSLLALDSQLAFADWGLSAELEDVQQRYLPDSGRVEEEVFRSQIVLIPQDEKPDPVSSASATLSLTQRSFLVRRSEVPQGIVMTSARLLVEQVRFHVRAVHESPIPGVLLLECVSDRLPVE